MTHVVDQKHAWEEKLELDQIRLVFWFDNGLSDGDVYLTTSHISSFQSPLIICFSLKYYWLLWLFKRIGYSACASVIAD